METKPERVFDAYEITAVVVPGASLLLGLWILNPHVLPELLSPKDVSLGGFGIFAAAAFCLGHIIQAPANAITDLGWRMFGRVTERMRNKGCGLPDSAVDRISAQLQTVLGISISIEGGDVAWKPVSAQMAIAVANAGRDARLQKFNGNYGLFRGLTASVTILFAYATLEHAWMSTALLFFLGWATRFRMKRFSGYYARELWMQFLALDAPADLAKEPVYYVAGGL